MTDAVIEELSHALQVLIYWKRPAIIQKMTEFGATDVASARQNTSVALGLNPWVSGDWIGEGGREAEGCMVKKYKNSP